MNTNIEIAANNVATTEASVAKATAHEQAARERVAYLRERIAAAESRKQATRADFQAGKLTEPEAGGIVSLLDADSADLRELLGDAETATTTAANATRNAEQERTHAQQSLRQAENVELFDALTTRAQELERQFVRTVAELARLAPAAGRSGNSLSAIYNVRSEVVQMVMHRQPPRIAA